MKIHTVIKFKKAVHKNIHNNDDNDELIWKNDFLMPKSLISPKDIFIGSHQCRHHYRVGDVTNRISSRAELSSDFDE